MKIAAVLLPPGPEIHVHIGWVWDGAEKWEIRIGAAGKITTLSERCSGVEKRNFV